MDGEGSKRNVESYQMMLASKESKIKIGKVLDEVNFDNSKIINDGKNFALYETRQGRSDIKYSGSSFAEQTSKYMIFKYNESNRRFEAFPVNEWYSFKKEINFAQTSTLEEVEEKMKPQPSVINLFKKKGAIEPLKKTKRKKNTTQGQGAAMDLEQLDEIQPEKEEAKPQEDGLSFAYSYSNDPELKDIPSDIDEGLKVTKELTGIEKILAVQNASPSEESDDSEDSFDVENNNANVSSDDFDNANSEINDDEIDKEIRESNMGFIGLKRKREDENEGNKKMKKTITLMEESLDNMLARNKQMTNEKIVKEMSKEYNAADIKAYLKVLLDKNTKVFSQGGETYHFKKIE